MDRRALLNALQLRRQCYYLTDKAFMLDCWHRSYSRHDGCTRASANNNNDDDSDNNDEDDSATLSALLAQARCIIADAAAQLRRAVRIDDDDGSDVHDDHDNNASSASASVWCAMHALQSALSPAPCDSDADGDKAATVTATTMTSSSRSPHSGCDAARRFACWDEAMQTLLCALDTDTDTTTTTAAAATQRATRHVVHTLLARLSLHLYLHGLHYYQARAMAETATTKTATNAAATHARKHDSDKDGDASDDTSARCSWSIAAPLSYSVYALFALDDACE